MRKWLLSVFSLVLSASAFGADPQTQQANNPPFKIAEEPTKTGALAAAPGEADGASKNLLSIDGGVDVTTAYFFRGYRQQYTGAQIQPYGTLSLNLQQPGTAVVTPYVGTWNSINTNTSAPWYETDITAGVNVGVGPLSLNLQYAYYESPAGEWRTSSEIGATLSLDDSSFKILPYAISINPHVAIVREINHSANLPTKSVANGPPGTYLEVGIEPTRVCKIGTTNVTFSIPTTFGMSIDHYYETSAGANNALGYGSIGLKASVPLPLPGEWKLTASVLYLRDFADSAKEANGGNANAVIGTVGIGFSF